jgi:voltage-gated potassium channel
MQSMVALFTTLVRLLRAVADGWRRDPQFRVLVGLVVFLLLSGTVFYSLHEGWSIVNAFYFSVTTLTTVGYGDLSPTTTLSKLFTVVYIFIGLSILLGFLDTVAKSETMRSRRRGRGSGEGGKDRGEEEDHEDAPGG